MTQSQPNSIVKADCLDFLRSLGDQSVDLVFSDPPYNAKKDYDVYKDNLTPEKYFLWMESVVRESRRVSKRGVIFYVSGKLSKTFFTLIPDAHQVVVHKKAAGVVSENYMLQYHCIFSTARPINKTKDLWDDVRLPGEGYFFREPRYPNPGLTSQKLVEKVLYVWTNIGDIVVDPFMGVGTTAAACKTMGRNYLGSELNPKYIKIAQKRIEEIPLFESEESPS